jgi:hypothetical protein
MLRSTRASSSGWPCGPASASRVRVPRSRTDPAEARIPFDADRRTTSLLGNEAMTALFQAVAEATEEAIYNSLFRATTTTGHRGTIEALPLESTLDVLRRHRVIE